MAPNPVLDLQIQEEGTCRGEIRPRLAGVCNTFWQCSAMQAIIREYASETKTNSEGFRSQQKSPEHGSVEQGAGRLPPGAHVRAHASSEESFFKALMA